MRLEKLLKVRVVAAIVDAPGTVRKQNLRTSQITRPHQVVAADAPRVGGLKMWVQLTRTQFHWNCDCERSAAIS